MVIACTRCGAKEDGEILTAPIAFAFKHDKGCAHGVGPLVVLRGQVKKPKEIFEGSREMPESTQKSEKSVQERPKDIRVEEKPKEKKSIKEKIKVFGKQDKKE